MQQGSSGVQRSLRPLPTVWTCGPGPSLMSELLTTGDVGDQIDPTQFLDGCRNATAGERLVRDVSRSQNSLLPGFSYQRGDLIVVDLLLGEVAQHDVGALSGKGDGHCPADPGVCAGDQSFPAGERPGSPVGLLAVIGLDGQVGIPPWAVLPLFREILRVCTA